ncbi:isopeptide-forming domain-containing fimbrial protein [Bacillus pseudomycoides]|uniref:Isopeptide-forming domain-containing fimbrial protein n=1 Tax=Bacillus bingmayongensis TaxID=1150157 RepID=A0ABU5JQN3_9BACI|nr:isopeptide-forming domain-containing fimbrial protein [Bacillus pseudomycoides]
MKKNIPILLTLFLLLQLFSPGLISLAATPVKDIEHKLQTNETANMCLREHEGKITFQWPLNKKKVDFVIVQDASGSFKGSIGNVKSALKKIVDQLDPQNDRVMVTSYQDYKGFKGRYNNVLNHSGPGVKTTLHSGLNSGIGSAKQGIDKINPNSGTPTASGLQFALQQYEKAKGADDPDRETIFLLVTDGVANVQSDGYIHKKSNQISDWTGRAWSSEYEQNYESALREVKEKAQNIKDKGYKLVTAFWENKDTLAAPNQYYDKYDREVGPYSRNVLQSMATKPEWFVLASDIEEFSKKLIETVTQVTKKEKDKMVLDIYNDLQIEDVQVSGPNGLNTKPIVKDNQIIWDLEGQPEGSYTVTYKVKETKPQPSEFDVAGGYVLSYDTKFEIPIVKAKSNPNAVNCSNVVTKKVSDSDEKLVEEASLKAIDEEFTYDVNYNFGYDVASKKEIILQDDLEDILEVLDTKLTSEEGKEIQVTPVINREKSIVTYKIPQQDGSYAYLAGQKYRLTITAKIKQGTGIEILKQFIVNGGVPNTAQLILDGKPSESNKVVVIPPIEEPKLHKTVSDSDETNVEGATLSNIREKFTWNVAYEFGNAPSAYSSIILQDDLEDVLDIIDVKVVNKKGETVNVEPKIDSNSKRVTVELPKKEGSYAYIAGEIYTMYITSKIADNAPVGEITKYIAKGGVPNKAELVLNNKPMVSNEVHVKPPTEKPKVTKTVSDSDEKNVEKAKLEAKNEEFTWNVDYKFGNDTAKLEKVVLQDDLEDILDILAVKLVDAKGKPVEVTPQIDEKTKKVMIELPKKDDSYAYLAGQTYTMHIQSKISDHASTEDIAKHLAQGGIPNKAELVMDNRPTVSNEAKVMPPTEKPKVTKMVSDSDEKDVEKAKLEAKDEEFTWNVNYKFGNDTAKLQKVILQDDLEDILDILAVKLVDAKGKPIEITPQIDEKAKKVTIELPKRDDSYAYLAGQTYTLHIQSKISDHASTEEITKYITKGGIPNKAELVLDNKSTASNEAKVVPPIGQIEIEKIDSKDANIKLKNAVFQIFDKEGKEVGKLTTDENGKAVSSQLLFGTYTIKEVQAPTGYMLLRDPIIVEITSKTPVQKIQVENSKSDWNIPETGGMGTTIFYVIGIVVMVATLIVFFRKRSSNL